MPDTRKEGPDTRAIRSTLLRETAYHGRLTTNAEADRRSLERTEAKERRKRKPADSVVAPGPPQKSKGQSRDKIGEAFVGGYTRV